MNDECFHGFVAETWYIEDDSQCFQLDPLLDKISCHLSETAIGSLVICFSAYCPCYSYTEESFDEVWLQWPLSLAQQHLHHNLVG